MVDRACKENALETRTLLFNLSNKLTYSKAGNFEDTLQLEVDGPNFETFKESNELSQAFTRALFSNRELFQQMNDETGGEQGADSDLDASVIRLLLFASKVDFNEITNVFLQLCYKACTLDQERKIKLLPDHVKKVNYEDMVNFVCAYFATFTAPSVLSGLQGMEGTTRA